MVVTRKLLSLHHIRQAHVVNRRCTWGSWLLSLINIFEPRRHLRTSYAVFCLKKKNIKTKTKSKSLNSTTANQDRLYMRTTGTTGITTTVARKTTLWNS